MASVGEESVVIAESGGLIQNLGPDALYVSDVDPATADNGVQVSVGRSVAVGYGDTYYGISAGTSDVRNLARGVGLFDADVS